MRPWNDDGDPRSNTWVFFETRCIRRKKSSLHIGRALAEYGDYSLRAWSERHWALPFLTVMLLSPKTSGKLGKRHRTSVARAGQLISQVRRWQPEREIVLVGDGSYAAVVLVQRCQRLKQPVKLVSRLRLDATLHGFPGPQPKSKPGPKPKKGARQPSLAARL